MPLRTTLRWSFNVLIPGIALWAIKAIWALITNALTGWGDDQIAHALHIESPTPKWVIDSLWDWGIPVLVLCSAAFAYHKWAASKSSSSATQGTPQLILPHGHPSSHAADANNRFQTWIALAAGVVGCMVVVGFISLRKAPASEATNTSQIADRANAPHRKLLTLRQLFESDWPDLPSFYGTILFNGKPLNIGWRLNGDFAARSKFFSLYIDSTVPLDDARSACQFFASNFENLIDSVDARVNVLGKTPDDTSPTRLKDMVFSKRVFIYYDNPEITSISKAAIEEELTRKGLAVEFFDHSYAWAHRNDIVSQISIPLTPGTLIVPDARANPGIVIHYDNLGPQGMLNVVTRNKQILYSQ
jgi:hypothetical protein